MKLTQRGKTVLFGGPLVAGALLGFFTANYCWYGYCGL